jgi:cold shock protein
MGRYKEFREPRRRQRYDNLPADLEWTAEPTPAQRPPSTAAGPVEAEVIWFNASKGFGFVKLPDGAEIYLHLRALEAAGSSGVAVGTHLRVTLEESPRGPVVAKVLVIDNQNVETRPPAVPTMSPSDRPLESAGTVKWYNSDKGFGFIAPDTGDKDLFVHASILARAGIGVLVQGQRVLVEAVPGKKGLEVSSIRLA